MYLHLHFSHLLPDSLSSLTCFFTRRHCRSQYTFDTSLTPRRHHVQRLHISHSTSTCDINTSADNAAEVASCFDKSQQPRPAQHHHPTMQLGPNSHIIYDFAFKQSTFTLFIDKSPRFSSTLLPLTCHSTLPRLHSSGSQGQASCQPGSAWEGRGPSALRSFLVHFMVDLFCLFVGNL